MRISYHCRFLQTGNVLQLHCQFFTQPAKFGSTNTAGSWDHPAEFSSTNTVGLCFNRQCSRKNHCRFVTRTDSATLPVYVSTGSVLVRITADLWQEPVVMYKPTLLVCGSSRQCYLVHHCRFVSNWQWCLRQHCRFAANRQWWHVRILLFYNLF